jgi:hypothetical protein
MPDEVRKWHEAQYARHIEQDRLEDRYAGVKTLDELRSLDAPDLFARKLQAHFDPAYTTRAGDPRRVAFEQEIAEVSAPRRQPIGIVPDGALVAHVLYRVEGPAVADPTEPAVLTMRRSDRGWSVLPRGEMFVVSGWTAYPTILYGTVGGVNGTAAEDPGPPYVQIEQTRWVKRTFPSGLPAGLLPPLLGRFEANVQRLSVLAYSVSQRGRTRRPAHGGWSIQEHAGHLLELERLGAIRLAEYEQGADVLSAADMSNRATEEAEYNQRAVEEILGTLYEMRFEMIDRLRRLTPAQLEHGALHPRLQQRMNVMDWLFFMCEHDDHHLAHMQRLKDEYLHELLHPVP